MKEQGKSWICRPRTSFWVSPLLRNTPLAFLSAAGCQSPVDLLSLVNAENLAKKEGESTKQGGPFPAGPVLAFPLGQAGIPPVSLLNIKETKACLQVAGCVGGEAAWGWMWCLLC